MVTRRFAPWRLYTSAELYESTALSRLCISADGSGTRLQIGRTQGPGVVRSNP